MLITDKTAFGFKFLLSLFIVAMFTNNGIAATVVPVDWLNNTSSNITDLDVLNVFEFRSDQSAADPNVGSDRIRLDTGNDGHISGTVTLPSVENWQLNFYVVTDESANEQVESEFVNLNFDGSLLSTIFNTPQNTATLISYNFQGDSFSFLFEFFSPIADRSRHLVVETGTVSVIPVPAAVWLFSSGLLGLAGAARRRKS